MKVGFDFIYPIHLINACTQTLPCSKRMSKSMSVWFREGLCRNCPILNITNDPRKNESPVTFPDVSDIQWIQKSRMGNWESWTQLACWNLKCSLSERIVGVESGPSLSPIYVLKLSHFWLSQKTWWHWVSANDKLMTCHHDICMMIRRRKTGSILAQ